MRRKDGAETYRGQIASDTVWFASAFTSASQDPASGLGDPRCRHKFRDCLDWSARVDCGDDLLIEGPETEVSVSKMPTRQRDNKSV